MLFFNINYLELEEKQFQIVWLIHGMEIPEKKNQETQDKGMCRTFRMKFNAEKRDVLYFGLVNVRNEEQELAKRICKNNDPKHDYAQILD